MKDLCFCNGIECHIQLYIIQHREFGGFDLLATLVVVFQQRAMRISGTSVMLPKCENVSVNIDFWFCLKQKLCCLLSFAFDACGPGFIYSYVSVGLEMFEQVIT